jgi:hypothetical protein
MSDDNLLGYLLDALDEPAQQEVELQLRRQPLVQQKLEVLRQAVEPLAADRESPDYEPAPGLRMRTLARVAEYRCREHQPPRPAPVLRPSVPASRSWWSRADVLVAASLLLIAFPLLFPILTRLQERSKIAECQNNLRSLYGAIVSYGEHHSGQLPHLEPNPPQNFAGVTVPILYEEGFLTPEVKLACPATGRRMVAPVSRAQLQDLYERDSDQFERYIREVGGCYAYPLGYWEAGQLHGFQLPDPSRQDELLPIMADRPPFEDSSDPLIGNSQNHGGTGQNVLRLGGQVQWCTSRNVGPDGDDIYLNRRQELDAGVDRFDSVLAASGVRVQPAGARPTGR